MHERHAQRKTHYAGWWGHTLDSRFAMPREFDPIPGAQGFQQSNPSVLTLVALLGSLETFAKAGGMQPLRKRSVHLTGLLEKGLKSSKHYVPPGEAGTAAKPGFTIITPEDPVARGAQLSLLFLPAGSEIMLRVFEGLKKHGIIGDKRRPDALRLAPAPLYNDETDVKRAVDAVDAALDKIVAETT